MLVLDANILIRAVLGTRVRAILARYHRSVDFIAPESAFAEARENLPEIVAKRGGPQEESVQELETLRPFVRAINFATYSPAEKMARERVDSRDPDDWPVLATALVFKCPIWTEDHDFFGVGLATWTSDRVEIFLSAEPSDG